MNLFKRLSPFYIPPATAKAGGLAILRERLLQTMLISVSILGTLLIIGSADVKFLEPLYSLPAIYIYIPIYIIILATTFSRNLPYNFRAAVLVHVVLILAIFELFENGYLGEVRLFLLGYVALTAVLLYVPNTIAAVVVSVLMLICLSIYGTNNPNPPIASLANLPKGTNWITSTFSFLGLAGLLSGSIVAIINGLNANLDRQAELSHSLETERNMLEERVHERTRSMARRMVQLRTSAEISGTISAMSDPEGFFQQVVELIKERFDLYYVGIFLLDSNRQYAVLRAGTGEPGKKMLAAGHQLPVGGTSMIGWCVANRKARIALDVGTEAVRFSNPNLPLTRSELALPIIAHDHVMGALTIQSEQPNAFDENDISVLQSIADSLAIALENDQLFRETRQRLEEIRALNRDYLQRAWTQTLDTYGELSYEYESPNTIEDRGQVNSVQVPLLLRDAVIGEVSLDIDRSDLTDEERAFIENITTQTAIALENARLLYETERRALQEQKLNELASRFSRALNIEEILRAAAQELGQLPAVAEVSVQLNPNTASGKVPPNPSSFVSGGNGKERA
jgi:GAF domain-containing protein